MPKDKKERQKMKRPEEKGVDYSYVEINPYEVDPQLPGIQVSGSGCLRSQDFLECSWVLYRFLYFKP